MVLILLGVMVPGWVYRDLKSQVAMKDDEIKAQRDRADAAVTAMQDTRNVIAALQMGLQMGLQGGDGRAGGHEAVPQGPPP